MKEKKLARIYPARRWFLVLFFVFVTVGLLWRIVDLQLLNNDFLRTAGEARSVRVVSIPAHRGDIVDRNDVPLAISTPVESVWAEPVKAILNKEKLNGLAEILDTEEEQLRQYLRDRVSRNFVYLKRHITPDQSGAIRDLSLEGIHLESEYKRYYPAGEVIAHLIGFTNVDDVGQEGIELAYDDWLKGSSGSKRVIKDRLGRIVEDIESIKSTSEGKKLILSIDKRVQYLAYRELTKAVVRHNAKGGSLLMLDVNTGEVMAIVGQPSYNPNNRSGLKSDHYRNRAATDVFEPGSTMKPFTVVAALMSGMFTPETEIDTSPGFYRVNNFTITDINNYGKIDVSNVIKKSSNIGASKIALALGPESLWDLYSMLGFGQATSSGFPGESPGLFNRYQNWSEAKLANMSFGYGLSVTMMQLAQAYSILATGGIQKQLTFLKSNNEVAGNRVLDEQIVKQVITMLESVVLKDGGGRRAAVDGYRVAGKTGTVHKAISGGYAEDRYMSIFAGFAPVSNPSLVTVVMIDEPQGEEHYGGEVAAPVFSDVMKGALRILNIAPDKLTSLDNKITMIQKESGEL